MINLLIVSDIRLYRESLAEIIDRNNTFQVQGTVDSIECAISVASNSALDVVLLDMTMVGSCNIMREILSSCPGVKIIVIAMTDDEDRILDCAKLGISGYVTRSSSLDQLIKAIERVEKGDFYCPRQLAERLFQKVNKINTLVNLPERGDFSEKLVSKASLLTQREREIAILLSKGKSNKQIARELIIEVNTVKNHVHNILSKVGARSRIQAVSLLQLHIAD